MDPIAQIKQKLDIVDVVGSYISLKKSGRNYKGLCPFHSDHNPSFMVSQELQIYKCFVCNDGGDVFKFVQKIEGIDFSTSLEQLAERAGVVLEKKDFDPQALLKKKIYAVNALTARFYNYILTKHPAGKIGLDYLKKQRKLDDIVIKEFQLGYAPDSYFLLKDFLIKKGFTESELISAGVVVNSQKGNDVIDKFRGRIIFPLTGVDKSVLGFNGRTVLQREPKYLNTSETPVFHKGSFIYGLDKARLNIKKEGVVFVEGQMDVISAHQEGIKNVVAVSGTSLTDNQLKTISRYTKDITFCFDSDSAGSAAVYRAVDMAEKMDFNIKVSVVPAPYKDLDELVKADVNKAKEFFSHAVPAYDFFLADVFKRFDKNSALGKKEITEKLIPIYSKISNPVLLQHYSKKLSEELEILPETILNMLKNPAPSPKLYSKYTEEPVRPLEIDYKTTHDGYILSLLFKVDIDTQRKYAYKLQSQDFDIPDLLAIYEAYMQYLQKDTKSFNIKSVAKSLSDEQKSIVDDLYIWDLDGLYDDDNAEKLEKELEKTFSRTKKESAKKTLKELTEKIKLAELENDFEQVQKLTKKVEKLKKILL